MSIKNQKYHRQILLKELGTEGQEKLLKAKVLVIGAGGLGCPALQYLAAAGIGHIGIVDYDIIDFTNLHRQILYNTLDIGLPKAIIAAQKLQLLNPDIIITPYHFRLTNRNALELLKDYDVIIDGSDNFATRYLINDACFLLKKTLIYGAIFRFEGQIAVFNHNQPTSVNFRDLFANPPNPSNSPACNIAGVLGVIPGIIGSLQATEAIKIIAEIGVPLYNCLLTYNALYNQSYQIQITPNPASIQFMPKNRTEFEFFDYFGFCSTFDDFREISPQTFETLLQTSDKLTIIDVREPFEMPLISHFPHLKIPLHELAKHINSLPSNNTVVVFCQSGQRSRQAYSIIKQHRDDLSIFSLAGGIEDWLITYKSRIV